jgi:hypothetical protein
LDQLHALKNFKVSHELSPLELAKLEFNQRKRASRSTANPESKKSDW